MRSRHAFFIWILPLIWGIASYAHSYHTGDEHGMYIISCIVGTWVPVFLRLPGDLKNPAFALTATMAGAVVFAIAGTIMDLIRSKPFRWAIVFMTAMLLIFAAMLRSHGTIEKAVAKNGSLWTYELSATVLALYVSVILCVLGNGLVRLYKAIRGIADDLDECVPEEQERKSDV